MKVDDCEKTSPVGSFAPNQFGLYDLGGNVREWCEDEFQPGLVSRVIRDRSWNDTGGDVSLLSSYRIGYSPVGRVNSCGFRVVLTKPESTVASN